MAAATGSLMGTMALLQTNANASEDPFPVNIFSNQDGSPPSSSDKQSRYLGKVKTFLQMCVQLLGEF
jgi:hypothetical protein